MNLKDYIELNGECEIIDVEALENIHFYKSTSSGFVIYWGLKMKEVM